MQCDTLLRTAAGILKDPGHVTWEEGDLLDYLNAAMLVVVSHRPDASVSIGEIPLVAGTEQDVPTAGHRLIDVFFNGTKAAPGNVIVKVSRDTKDRVSPAWHGATQAATVDEVVVDEHFPSKFWASPPSDGTNTIVAGWTVTPSPVNGADDDFPLLDKYVPATVEWMLYLAFARDSEDTPNVGRSEIHKSTSLQLLGAKTQVDLATAPARRKKGTD